jgi:hypothetical protein
MNPTVFTLEAVNALVPRLQLLMEAQMGRRSAIELRLEQLAELIGVVPQSIDVEDGDDVAVRTLKHDLLQRLETYEGAWNEVERMGAVLKDPRAGLVDFYGSVDGKLVWLCWKYGEDRVSHYHGLDEGFAGRKPIAPDVRSRHLN